MSLAPEYDPPAPVTAAPVAPISGLDVMVAYHWALPLSYYYWRFIKTRPSVIPGLIGSLLVSAAVVFLLDIAVKNVPLLLAATMASSLTPRMFFKLFIAQSSYKELEQVLTKPYTISRNRNTVRFNSIDTNPDPSQLGPVAWPQFEFELSDREFEKFSKVLKLLEKPVPPAPLPQLRPAQTTDIAIF